MELHSGQLEPASDVSHVGAGTGLRLTSPVWGVGLVQQRGMFLGRQLWCLTRSNHLGCSHNRAPSSAGVTPPNTLAARQTHPANVSLSLTTAQASSQRATQSRVPNTGRRDKKPLPIDALELCAFHVQAQGSRAAAAHHGEHAGSHPRPESCGRPAPGTVPLVPWLERRSLVSAQVRLHVLCELL